MGMLLGEFVGGGAVVFAAKAILQTRYTRGVETAADAYGVVLLTKLGGDPRALTDLLLRIAGTSHGGPKILLDHPDTRDRVAAIEALAPPRPSVPSARQAGEPPRPLLDPAEWAAVKAICAGS